MNTNKKTSRNELLKLYVALHPGQPFTSEEVYHWGLSKGYDTTPDIDPVVIAIRKMKAAIKGAHFNDPQGRKIPQFISVGDELPLWADLTITPHTVVQRSLDMCRGKAVQTLAQVQTVADSYNDNFNLSGTDVRVNLDVTDDVLEEVIMRRNRTFRNDLFDDDGEEEQ